MLPRVEILPPCVFNHLSITLGRFSSIFIFLGSASGDKKSNALPARNPIDLIRS